MRLTFVRKHLSIDSFPATDLPDFTVITGPNGAGKSHLLQAIGSGHIKVDLTENTIRTNEIVFFDWNTLIPREEVELSSSTIAVEIEGVRNQLDGLKQQYVKDRFQGLGTSTDIKYTIPPHLLNNPIELIRIADQDLAEVISEGVDVSIVKRDISNAIQSADVETKDYFDIDQQSILIYASKNSNKPISLLNAQDISNLQPNWGRAGLFKKSVARIFIAYRDAQLSNSLAEFRSFKGCNGETFVSAAKFTEEYGVAPWELVNETMSQAGLDFAINSPDLYAFSNYTPRLNKISNGADVPFSGLSSGEKILMSLALSIYAGNDRRQLTDYPKLILFDEIDAPLHPSMTKSLIGTITDTLVGKFGMKVIATTHSPSTVALSPDDAIFLMRPGHPGLRRSPKSEALNILTFGVPTLAISYDGRRQVFVESPADAKTYGDLYAVFRTRLPSERSLEFVATGSRNAEGQDEGTGCTVVQRLVETLVSSGNQSVFGLVDSDDHKNRPSDRILILGKGERDGLENFLLDPVLLTALICRNFRQYKQKIGIAQDISYIKLLSDGPQAMQSYVNAICKSVFDENGEYVREMYFGQFEINIDVRWRTEDDHELEAKITKAFPFLKTVAKKAGDLVRQVINDVLADQPDLAPLALVETLRDLLERDAHI